MGVQLAVQRCQFPDCANVAAGFWVHGIKLFFACVECRRKHKHYRWVFRPYVPVSVQSVRES